MYAGSPTCFARLASSGTRMHTILSINEFLKFWFTKYKRPIIMLKHFRYLVCRIYQFPVLILYFFCIVCWFFFFNILARCLLALFPHWYLPFEILLNTLLVSYSIRSFNSSIFITNAWYSFKWSPLCLCHCSNLYSSFIRVPIFLSLYLEHNGA